MKDLNYENPIRTSILARRIEIFLDREIVEPESFREEIHAIRSAGPNDEVILYINTPGGRLDTTKSLVSAILQSEAPITAQVEGTVASAGTILTCACTHVNIMPHTEFMIHSAYGGAIGDMRNAEAQIVFMRKSVEALYRDVYKDFLTDEEMETVLNGRELWLTAEELQQRFKARREKWTAQAALEDEEVIAD